MSGTRQPVLSGQEAVGGDAAGILSLPFLQLLPASLSRARPLLDIVLIPADLILILPDPEPSPGILALGLALLSPSFVSSRRLPICFLSPFPMQTQLSPVPAFPLPSLPSSIPELRYLVGSSNMAPVSVPLSPPLATF